MFRGDKLALYLSVVFIGMTIISGLNILLYSPQFPNHIIWTICAVILSVIVEIAISGIGSFICVKCPDKWFSPEKRFFKVTKREQRLLEKLGIKSWKDKVWELGGLGGFSKNKIKDPRNVKYLHRFIIESNKGMVGHMINMCTGFLVVLVLPLKYAWRIGVPVAIVGLFLNLMPTLVLRYNLPKLAVAHKRATRLEERSKIKDSSIVTEDEDDEEKVLNA